MLRYVSSGGKLLAVDDRRDLFITAEDIDVAFPAHPATIADNTRNEGLNDDPSVDAFVLESRDHIGKTHLRKVHILQTQPTLAERRRQGNLGRVAAPTGHQPQPLQVPVILHLACVDQVLADHQRGEIPLGAGRLALVCDDAQANPAIGRVEQTRRQTAGSDLELAAGEWRNHVNQRLEALDVEVNTFLLEVAAFVGYEDPSV